MLCAAVTALYVAAQSVLINFTAVTYYEIENNANRSPYICYFKELTALGTRRTAVRSVSKFASKYKLK